MRKDIKQIVDKKIKKLNDEIKEWAKANKYLDDDGNNVKQLSNSETVEMLKKLEEHLSEYDKANGYIFSKVPENRTIIPYTDQYKNIFSWRMADNISERTPKYSYVSETAIGQISMNPSFKKLLFSITGRDQSLTADKHFISKLIWERKRHPEKESTINHKARFLKTERHIIQE